MINREREPWRFFAALSQPCPLPTGTRIETTGRMRNDPSPLPPGSRGTITGGNGAQLFVDWDNGSRLMLLVDQDPYRILTYPDGYGAAEPQWPSPTRPRPNR